jgi:hypothetical protein
MILLFQLFYGYENPYCNHNVNDDINSCNYIERGKHLNDYYDIFNDPVHMLKCSKLHVSNVHTIEFSSSMATIMKNM